MATEHFRRAAIKMRAKNNFYGILQSHTVQICSSYSTQAAQNKEIWDGKKEKLTSFKRHSH